MTMFTYEYEKLPTKVFGLKYVPLLNKYSMDTDLPPVRLPRLKKVIGNDFTQLNQDVLIEEMHRLGDNLKCILEIGLSPEEKNGSSFVILENKPKDAVYLGVDVSNKSWVTKYENANFLQTTTADRPSVLQSLKSAGCEKIDLLFIDGWHSVNMMLTDWLYTSLLSEHGTVLIHDISVHPGPVLIYEAIDEAVFDKVKYESHDDWGIGVARRK